jgi:hypothetical protein
MSTSETTIPSPGGSQTITAPAGGEVAQQALQVVQLSGNIHGFGVAPQQPAPASTGPGIALGTAPIDQIPAANLNLRQLHQERMSRLQEAQAQPPSVPPAADANPRSAPLPPDPSPASGSGTGPLRPGQKLNLRPGLKTAAGAPDPGPPGGGGSRTVSGFRDEELRLLLRRLAERRVELLQRLQRLLYAWRHVPCFELDALMVPLLQIQREMQQLEMDTALQVLRVGGGSRPGGAGGSTSVNASPPVALRLRLRPSPARLRFLAAQAELERLEQQLLAAHQAHAQQQQHFTQMQQQVAAQQNLLLAGQQAHAQQQQHFTQMQQQIAAQQNLLLAGQQAHTQQHQHFTQMQQQLAAHQPQLLAGQQAHAQQHQNFTQMQQQIAAQQNLLLAGQQARRQRRQRMLAALANLQAHPPLPLLQGPVVRNPRTAPAAYALPNHRRQHLLHGDHTGGQHMGHYNPGLHGAAPNVLTTHAFPGHFVTYFPVAWDAEDIVGAVAEAAEATYYHAWQQPNGNWRHPPVRVSRRGISIWVVVITRVGHHGQLQVWTAWPQ